jgi:HAD superfamily hydrolase (TIGR01509 family)
MLKDLNRINYLLLDLGGVLLNDPIEEFFNELNRLSPRNHQEIVDFYSQNLRLPLWSGSLKEKDFWQQLLGFVDIYQVDSLSDYIRNLSWPLPASEKLQELKKVASLAVLSNHRSEWVRPVLNQTGLDKYFQEVFISSEIGLVKPDLKAIEYVLNRLDCNSKEVVFIDDKERNLKTAQQLGVQTVLATPEGSWVDQFLATE